MEAKPSIKKNASLNLLKTLMSLLFPLVTFPYSSRILKPEGIGYVNFANSIISYFSMFASLGIYAYGIREGAKLRDKPQALSQFARELFTINMVSTVLAYAFLAIGILCIPLFWDYRYILIVSSGSILFMTIGMDWLYGAEEDYAYITKRTILFQFVSIILLYTLVKKPDDYLKYAAISVFSNVGANILNFVHSRVYISFKGTHRGNLKPHIKPVCILFAMSIAAKVYSSFDNLMLGIMASVREVGLYSAATKVSYMVLSLVTSISMVTLPRLSYYLAKDDKEEFNKLASKGIETLFLIALPCSIGMMVVAEPTIKLLSGEAFVDAIPAMRIMCPIICIVGLSNFISNQIFLPSRKEKWALVTLIVGSITNILCNSLLIPKYGASGAALGSIIAESVAALLSIVLARNFFPILPVLPKSLPYIFDSLVMGIPAYYIVRSNLPPYLNLPLAIVAGAGTYAILLLLEKNPLVFSVLSAIRTKISRKLHR